MTNTGTLFGGRAVSLGLPTPPPPPLPPGTVQWAPVANPSSHQFNLAPLPNQMPITPAPTTPDPLLPAFPSPPITQSFSDRYEYDAEEEDMTMSETDENLCPEVRDGRLPMANFEDASEEGLAEAEAGLAEMGLHMDRLGQMVEQVQSANGGLIEEMDRVTQGVADTKETAVLCSRAMDYIEHAMASLPVSDAATEEQRHLEVAAGGLKDAMLCTQGRRTMLEDEAGMINCKMVLMQRLGKGVAENNPIPSCGICCARAVGVVARPCGHMFCGECGKRMSRQRRKNCYVCKRKLTECMNVYFP